METLTNIINYTALAMAVWLGIYLVTHSYRSWITLLSALTLWSIAGVFLNSLLALNPPPASVSWPDWLHYLMPFWSFNAVQMGWTEWIQGWLVVPAVAFWHHATSLMIPEEMSTWRRIRVVIIYAVALAGILILVYTPWLLERITGDPLSLDSIKPGPLFPVFLGLLLVFILLCIANLVQATHQLTAPASRSQMWILITATSLTALVSLAALAYYFFGFHIPTVVVSILLGCAIFLTGYGVARYSALTQGRPLRRDFLYNATAISLVVAIYMTITWFSVQLYLVPSTAFIFMLILAIVSHSLVDFTRRNLDLIFFRKNARRLRAKLREISRMVDENSTQEKSTQMMVDSICSSIRADFGLLLLFSRNEAQLSAVYGWQQEDPKMDPSALCSDDIELLSPGRFPDPLIDGAILVPLYGDGTQFGALLIGKPSDGSEFSEDEIDSLYHPCDQLAYYLHDNFRKQEYLDEIEKLVLSPPAAFSARAEFIDSFQVEVCLRNLYDYAYLGASNLADLESVRRCLPAGSVTHLDKGKAVHTFLIQGIEKLRPYEQDPCSQPPRKWYSYLILTYAYIEDKSNREIMSSLYISEGTFNRTRRSAIRAVTRALNEMEAVLN